jgi:hypothetical protein
MSGQPVDIVSSAKQPVSARRVWLARGIAVLADAVQIIFMPMFAEGIASPVNDALDVVVAFVLILLVGWHIAFVPTFIVKVLPFADLAPTWTIAVLIATRQKSRPSPPAGEFPSKSG